LARAGDVGGFEALAFGVGTVAIGALATTAPFSWTAFADTVGGAVVAAAPAGLVAVGAGTDAATGAGTVFCRVAR
jgi:hypothetical protein